VSARMLRTSALSYGMLLLACTSTGTAGLSAPPDAGVDATIDGGRDCGTGSRAGECEDAGSMPERDAAADACHGRPCEPCETDATCSDGLVCSAEGHCVECRENLHCTSGERTRCEPASGECVQCLADMDCSDADEPACAPWGTCAGRCLDDTACEDEERCAKSLGLCVQCLADADCKDGLGLCDVARGRCLECRRDSDCEPDEPHCIAGDCRP